MNKLKKNLNKENLDVLYRRRDMLDAERIKQSSSLDKYLLTFSTGTLYLSINFTDKINNKLNSICLLGWGWAILIISIFSVLISFYGAVKAHQRQIEINDVYINKELYKNVKINDTSNFWNTFVGVFNIIAISSFVIGVIILTIFYFINI
jgi:hypothetical protein